MTIEVDYEDIREQALLQVFEARTPQAPVEVVTDRLLQWAAGLEVLAKDDRFDMRFWFSKNEATCTFSEFQRGDCGTAACAAGWLPEIFPEDFFIVTSGRGSFCPVPNGHKFGESFYIGPFFGLTDEEVAYVTDPEFFVTRNPNRFEVAERIRDLAYDRVQLDT